MKHTLLCAPWLSAMARVFDQAGAELYIVGGAVRNPLFGDLPLSDVDVCGPALPDEVCALCQGTPVRTVIRAAELGTVELYVTDENGVEQMAEYTAWRNDHYTGGHRPDRVTFTRDMAVDARRRDFSVNAFYQRVHPDGLGEVIDPTGGLVHLAAGALHTVTEDPDRVLENDGARILRAARFAAEFDLQPTPEMSQSLRRYAHLVSEITPVRIAGELKKILMADLRYPSLRRKRPATAFGLSILQTCGAWAHAFGDLPYDEAAAHAMEGLGGTLVQRAALLCRKAPDAEGCLRRIGLREEERAQALAILSALNHPNDLPVLARAGMDAIASALRILHALGQDQSRLLQSQKQLADKPLSLKELAVNGNDLWPLLAAQGREKRELGQLLNHLWQRVLTGDVPNRREELLEEIKKGEKRQ